MPVNKKSAIQEKEPIIVNVLRKNILRPPESAIPERRGEKKAIIM
jgi:hypothetical protein